MNTLPIDIPAPVNTTQYSLLILFAICILILTGFIVWVKTKRKWDGGERREGSELGIIGRDVERLKVLENERKKELREFKKDVKDFINQNEEQHKEMHKRIDAIPKEIFDMLRPYIDAVAEKHNTHRDNNDG